MTDKKIFSKMAEPPNKNGVGKVVFLTEVDFSMSKRDENENKWTLA